MGTARPGRGAAPGTRDTGAAALEFALVSPLLLTLLFMIFSAGWGLWEYQAVRATAREATRLAAVGIPDLAAYQRGVVCLGQRNGLPAGALTAVDITFHADALLTGLAGAAPAPGGYVEVRITVASALRGVVPTLLTDDTGHVTTGAVSRIEQLGGTDLRADASLTTTGTVCP
ncbi:MAG: pilus assembly protein [Actinomycetota bacterium]|nr:pilus assembly protein [Actinomycetota bacterium]